MDDRFKFRFYDNDKKIMIDEDTDFEMLLSKYGKDEWYCCFEAIFPTILDYFDYDEYDKKDFVIMQCTGLKDSNGRLIYEGDIVEVKYIGGQIPLFKNEYVNEPESERFQIYWNENWCSWSGKNDNYRGLCEIHSLDISKFLINTDNKLYEVIGNIYENKELLNV